MIKLKGIKKTYIVMLLLLICILSAGCMKKVNKKYVELDEYLNISDIGSYKGSAIVVNGELRGLGFVDGETYFIPYEIVREYIDNNYYWDKSEQLITYASSKHIYDMKLPAGEYTKDGEAEELIIKVATVVDDKPYISLEYLQLMNGAIKGDCYEEPSRIVINTKEKLETVTAEANTKLRSSESKSAEIVKDIKKGDKLTVIETKGDFLFAYSEDGLMGYVEGAKVSAASVEDVDMSNGWMYSSPYEYISMEQKVCLGWHQMESAAGNDSLSSMISGADGLNVISPTWFKLIDDNGSISSFASSKYVDKAHDNGLQVWGLISDFNYDEDGNYYVNTVVSNTTSRRTLIANIIKEATECGMDGINVDFEMVRKVAAEGYVQFIRELAIECEKVNLVLSVDMYVPTESNQYYDRTSVGMVSDYLIIMGYDEHWATCGTAGSVASLPYVTNGITDTLEEVPASRVINAIPFYTRIWYEDSLDNAPEGAIVIEDAINGDYALSSRAVGMGAAEKILAENGATTRWLEDIGQNYGEFYTAEGRFGRVWLEDKESLTLKLNAMKESGIAGVACWKLGLESEEAWEVIGEYLK